MKKILLIGYMGCGKSTISKKLAQKNKLNHLDLDNLIEKNEGMTISTIFLKKGEIYFRKMEHKIFKDKMTSNDSFIMSTGGGTLCYFNNFEFLKREDCLSIFLSASIDTLYTRLVKDIGSRPMIANVSISELKEFIAKHLFERNDYYNKAKYKVIVDNKTEDEIVLEIQALLT